MNIVRFTQATPLGFIKGGRREFEPYEQGALGGLKKNDWEEEQPWKVE